MDHHQQVIVGGDVVLALAWVGLYVFTMRRWTPERGRDAARTWADKRQVLLVPPAVIEWAGARLSRMPQPANSAAHLYMQDAFRSDLLRFASFRSALAAATLTGYVGLATVVGAQAWLPAVLVGLGALLLVALVREVGDLRQDPVGYMRSRLWRGVAAS
jgi:hypothetical protein